MKRRNTSGDGVRRWRATFSLVAIALAALSASCIMPQSQQPPAGPPTGVNPWVPFWTPTPNITAPSAPAAAATAAATAAAPSAPRVQHGEQDPARQPRVGSLAPDFELDKLDGSGTIRLSQLQGRPVFINFWATWCGPCKIEMPDIEQIHQQYKDQGLVVLGIDVAEPASKVSDFVNTYRYSWLMVIDHDSRVMRNYRVQGIPGSFFIDRDGYIRDIVIGFTNRETMEKKIRPLLGLATR